MSRLTPRQSRLALILGVTAYGLVVAGVLGWLIYYGDDMRRIMASHTSRVTVVMAAPDAVPVPESWHATPPVAAPVVPPAKEAVHAAPDAMPAVAPVAAIAKWQKYARPFDQADKRARIVLVVPAFALSDEALKAATTELPGEVTLAFASGMPSLEQAIDAARAAGHEALLAVPMEPQNYPQNDPGRNVLLTGLPDADNLDRLQRGLAQADGYVAVMPVMGEKFVTSEQKLTPVLQAVKESGAAFFDGTGTRESIVAPIARLTKLPFMRSDMIIDASQNGADMTLQLAALEKLAREKGQAVAIVLPYPAALEKLKIWSSSLDKKTVTLAPLTAALQ